MQKLIKISVIENKYLDEIIFYIYFLATISQKSQNSNVFNKNLKKKPYLRKTR
jgi:hypothetical protein